MKVKVFVDDAGTIAIAASGTREAELLSLARRWSEVTEELEHDYPTEPKIVSWRNMYPVSNGKSYPTRRGADEAAASHRLGYIVRYSDGSFDMLPLDTDKETYE